MSEDTDRRCRYAASGFPACMAGRGERWWCRACTEFEVIRWLVDVLHYPFDVSFSTPPPVDHRRLADYWNASDGWRLTSDEAFAAVTEEAHLTPAPTHDRERQEA